MCILGRMFFCVLLLFLSSVLSPVLADQGSCSVLYEDFSGSQANQWSFDLPGEWSDASGKLVAKPGSNSSWAIAETSLRPSSYFSVDVDLSFNNENGSVALYTYTTGNTLFTIDGHQVDGVSVILNPSQKKMNFAVWNIESNSWNSTDLYDVAENIKSIGIKYVASALIFRLNGQDSQLSLEGDFSSASVINKLWLTATGIGFQASFDNVCARLNSGGNISPLYKYFSYVPYLSSQSSTGCWTGLALTNRNNSNNQVLVEYYSKNGVRLGFETKELSANGQTSFLTKVPDGSDGWIKISSTQSLKGLALVGQSSPPSMFDMDLKTDLHTRLRLSHLAADTKWNSLVMICNPSNSAAFITYKSYGTNGALTATRSSSVPANGSVQDNLYTLFGRALTGSMIIESNQPITAFLLYDSNERTWKAGLSAIPIQ